MCFPAFQRRHLICSIALLAAGALAAPLPPRFTLGNYVPEGAWLYVHAASNPQREWLDQKWSEVFDTAKAAGIDKDVMSLITSMMSTEDRAKFDATLDKVTTLLRGVNWSDLVKHEFVFAEGLSNGGMGWGYVVLARGADGSGSANAAGLVAILKEIASLSPKVVLSDSKVQEVECWSLRLGVDALEHAPFVFDLLRKGDVVGLAFELPFNSSGTASRATFNDVAALLNGQSAKKSMVAGARFLDAIAQVKPPQDTIFFFDTKSFLADLGRLFEGIAKHETAKHAEAKKDAASGGDKTAPTPAADGEKDEDARAMAMLRKIIAHCDFLDYTITSVETKDRREWSREVTKLQPGKETRPLAAAFCLRKPFEKFDQFVPADAIGFSLDGFVDLGEIYKLVLDFIAEELPQGKDIVAGINMKLMEIGFNPQRDLFDWLSGEMISVELPPAVVTPMSSTDSVTLIRVKNAELASQKVNAAIDFLASKMQGQGQALMVTPAKVNAEGFRELTHPALAMFIRPVVGVQGDWLMLGSSAAALNKCLDTAAGKTPSIRENQRFKDEGIVPNGPVLSASFRDTSKNGQELAGVAGMVGLFGGMAVAQIPDTDENSRKGKQALQSALAIVMKLGPVLQKIDFYSSESAVSTYDGKSMIRKESVTTYKATSEPALTAKPAVPPAAPTPPAPPQAPK